jgi:hypothetical protein
MTKVLRIPGASYGKNKKILSDALADGSLDMIIFTHEQPKRHADEGSEPLPVKDGVCLIAASTAQQNEALAEVVLQEKSGGQMMLQYSINSMGYYLPEFGDARLVRRNPLAVDDKGLIDMVAFSPKDIEVFGYDPAAFEFVRDIYTQGKAGAAIAAAEPGSRMIVTGPASGNTDGIAGAMSVVVGPKDLTALQALFALAKKLDVSVTELVADISESYEPTAKTVPGHPAIDLSQGQA